MEEPKPSALERVAAGVLACVVLAYVPVYLSLPLARDQGLFAWVAMVMRDGGLPFRDAWEVKGPLVYLLYVIPVGLFGSNSWGVRLVDLLFVLGGMGMVYGALRPRVSPPVAVLGALLLFTYYTHDFWNAAQADGWASLMLLGCLVLLLADRGQRRPRVALLVGVLLGAMFLIKPPYALFCVLPPIHALASEPRAWRANGAFVVTAALGVLATIGLLVFVFWVRGGLEAMLDIQLGWNIQVYRSLYSLPLGARLQELRFQLGAPSLLALHVLGLAGLGVYARSARHEAVLLSTAWAAGLLSIVIQGRFYPYHFFILYPALLLGTGLGLRATSEVLKDKPLALRVLPRLGAAGLLVFGLHLPVRMMLMRTEDRLDFLSGRLGTEEYNATFTWGDYYYADIAALAQHVSETTAPEDTVLVYGLDAGINFLAHRHSPTRFGFQYPLVIGTEEFKTRYRAEFLQALEAHPPRLIILSDHIDNPLYRATVPGQMRDFPALRDYIERGYSPDVQTPHYFVFRRGKPAGAPPSPSREAAGTHGGG
jgi:hypothetical protein